MSDHRICKNFTRDEFLRTSYKEYQAINAEEGLEFVGALTQLAAGLLQRIRDVWGPMTITSGYRCKKLNDAVGSTDRSQHRKGQAADVVIKNVPLDDKAKVKEFFEWLKNEYDEGCIDFHQVLLERGCIHFSSPTGSNDGQIGTWSKSKGAKVKKKKSNG